MEQAASELDAAAARLLEAVRAQVIEIFERGWKGEGATKFWQATQAREGRLRGAASQLRRIADDLRRDARARDEEEERSRASQRSGGRGW